MNLNIRLKGLFRPSYFIQMADAGLTTDISFALAIIFGLIKGIQQNSVATFGLMVSIGVGIITSLFGLFIFSEFLRWLATKLGAIKTFLIRSILMQALIPQIFLGVFTALFPNLESELLLLAGFQLWTFILLLFMIRSHTGLNYLRTLLVLLLPLALQVLSILV